VSFRFRIAAWVVISCVVMIGVMVFAGHCELEEELRQGKKDRTHSDLPGWSLHNSYTEAEIDDILNEVLKGWFLAGMPMIGLSLGVGLLLAHRVLRPVHDINRQIAEMRPNSLHGGITIPEADPTIANLANHLNVLLDRAGLAYQEMAEFSARVAHELRTPLMLLRMRLEHAPAGTPPAFQEEMQDELARLSRFVERSLLAAKAEQGVLVPVPASVDLTHLVRDVAEDYQLLAAERALGVTFEIAENLRIDADADLLRRALHGLLENAVRYAKSEIHLSCRADGAVVLLEIRNDGEPKTMATAGLGLGLRLVRGICEASGFDFQFHDSGSEFTARIRFAQSR
jgi:signal transduction histidine kinase